MKLPTKFKADDHEDMGFQIVPAGSYLAEIVKSELKETKKKDGQYLQLEWKLLDAGKHTGQIIFSRLNLVNPNQTAVDIANRELATICRSMNLPICNDSDQLHGKPVTIKVGVETGRGDYPDQNRINGYSPAKGGGGDGGKGGDKKNKKGKKDKYVIIDWKISAAGALQISCRCKGYANLFRDEHSR